MNVCVVTGTVAQVLQDTPGERVFLLDTHETTPQRIVMKFAGDARIDVGQRIETLGHLVMEPVRVEGTPVLVHGKAIHRPAYWADSIVLGAPELVSQPTRKEAPDVTGPALPWK
jgi:hypothetical protein